MKLTLRKITPIKKLTSIKRLSLASLGLAIAPILVVAGLSSVNHSLMAQSAPKQFDAPEDHPLPEIMSGYLFRASETQALQDDEFINPAMLWYERGEEYWNEKDGAKNASCQDCHSDAGNSMVGVGASYPKWNDALQKPITLEQQINLCRKNNMEAKEWKWESDHMLSTVVYVKRQSFGMPVSVEIGGNMAPHYENGKRLYYKRTGQLNLACANCHEDNYGNNIRSDHLSQGQSNGFPTYRLKSQAVLSLHKRFEGCVRDSRAEFPKRGSPEFVDLELYLAWRGQGLPVETPAVRN